MPAKSKTQKKSKKPLTVPRRTNLPKLSLVPAAKPEAAKPEVAKPEPAATEPVPKPKLARGPKPSKATKVKPPKAERPKAERPKAERPKAERPSALNAAALVLDDADTPMTVQQLIVAMTEQKLWISPGGKTPAATLHAAISKEITLKGADSRFRKVGRGLFAATAGAADSTPAEVSGIAAPAPELS
jgi:HB1, ASXL, restriction endonuclease HTH domain